MSPVWAGNLLSAHRVFLPERDARLSSFDYPLILCISKRLIINLLRTLGDPFFASFPSPSRLQESRTSKLALRPVDCSLILNMMVCSTLSRDCAVFY